MLPNPLHTIALQPKDSKLDLQCITCGRANSCKPLIIITDPPSGVRGHIFGVASGQSEPFVPCTQLKSFFSNDSSYLVDRKTIVTIVVVAVVLEVLGGRGAGDALLVLVVVVVVVVVVVLLLVLVVVMVVVWWMLELPSSR